jgi:hypothetical protein
LEEYLKYSDFLQTATYLLLNTKTMEDDKEMSELIQRTKALKAKAIAYLNGDNNSINRLNNEQ